MPVKVGSIGPLEIGEKAPDPWLKMLLEQLAIRIGGSTKASVRQARHDLAQNRRVILGLRLAGGSLDCKLFKMRAQPRERTLMQKAGEIIRRVGQKLSAPEPDEQVEIFPLDAFGAGPLRRLRERRVCQPERAWIPAQRGETLEQRAVRRAREQNGEQRIFLCARYVEVLEIASHIGLLLVEIGP